MPASPISRVDTTAYGAFVADLEALRTQVRRGDGDPALVAHALDGAAGQRLRELLTREARRDAGLFFTGSDLASSVADAVADTIEAHSAIYDPSCGAGDLLLAILRRHPARDSPRIARLLRGRDLQAEFVRAAKVRLSLATPGSQMRPSDFRGVELGCGLSRRRLPGGTTHVVMNPPFNHREADEGCDWASGRVNSGAVFLERILTQAPAGVRVAAVLPDVLRSGSRYARWRAAVDSLAAVDAIDVLGRFDKWTDVDTFLLRLTVGWAGAAAWSQQVTTGLRVADIFTVGTGAVVHNRDPFTGPEVAYLRAIALKPWTVVRRISGRRRFNGTLEKPPFVAVRRTSSPKEPCRVRANVVLGSRPVAVDNHLLVLRPRGDSAVDDCLQALEALRRRETTEWLNDRIRCRHLTVDAVADIPWALS